MKKIILLLLLILPVLIVVASFAIAGVVGREILYVEIEDIELSDSDGFYAEGYWLQGQRYVLPEAKAGETYELAKFFTVVPQKAKFSDLVFASGNIDAARVEDGKIHVTQNMKTSDKGEIKLSAPYGVNSSFDIYVRIVRDYDRFDYFNVNYNMLSQAISGDYWPVFCRADTVAGYLIIEKNNIPGGLKISNFGGLILGSLDVAPYDLLYDSFSGRPDFAKFIGFTLDDPGSNEILKLTEKGQDADGVNIFDAEILGYGEAVLTIKADWKSVTLETKVRILII